MNGKRWRKAGLLAALSLSLAAPVDAFLLFADGEPVTVEPAVEYHNAELGEYFVTVSCRGDRGARRGIGAADGLACGSRSSRSTARPPCAW